MTKTLSTLAFAFTLLAGAVPAQANYNYIALDDVLAGAPEQDPGKGEEGQGEEDQNQDQDQSKPGEEGQGFATSSGDLESSLRPRRPGRGNSGLACYARNRVGNTWGVQGRARDARWLQQIAVRTCRQNSIFFLRNTCRPIGCRYLR